jgi:hypothetical protein
VFAEETAAAETRVLGAAKAIAAGFFRSTGTGVASLYGMNTISLRTGAARVISSSAAGAAGDAA